jgi:hypothetical protein
MDIEPVRRALLSAMRRAGGSGAVCAAPENVTAADEPFESAAAAAGLIQAVGAAP